MREEHFLSLNIRVEDVVEIIVGVDKHLGYFIEMSPFTALDDALTVVIAPVMTLGMRRYEPVSEDEVLIELSTIDKITVFGRVTTTMESN